jgi:hypothetical protein
MRLGETYLLLSLRASEPPTSCVTTIEVGST